MGYRMDFTTQETFLLIMDFNEAQAEVTFKWQENYVDIWVMVAEWKGEWMKVDFQLLQIFTVKQNPTWKLFIGMFFYFPTKAAKG